MDNVILEINKIKSKMGIGTLNESLIPPNWIIKISKYFVELVNAKYIDELLTNKKITNDEYRFLKDNASDISRKSKNLVDPNDLKNDDILRRFSKIINKPEIGAKTLQKLSDNAIGLYIKSHPKIKSVADGTMSTINTLLDDFKKGKEITSPGFLKLVEEKKQSLSDYYRNQLEINPYFPDDKDLIDYLVNQFKNDPRFKYGDDILQGKVSQGISDITQELANEGLDKIQVDWATRQFFNVYPNIYNIIKSGLGTLNPQDAENQALIVMDALVKKVGNETPKNPLDIDNEFYNLMLKLKSDIIQAQTKNKKFDEIWEELKTNIPKEITDKIENFEGGSYESIKNYIEFENKLLRSPKLKQVFDKKFNDRDRSGLIKQFLSIAETPKIDFKKALPIFNNLFTRIIVRSIQWMTKSKFFNYLFWENLSSVKSILQQLTKGGVRKGLFWKNVIFLYGKMISINYILNPLNILINNFVLYIKDVLGVVEIEDDRTFFEKTADESLSALTFGLVGDEKKLSESLGLYFNPFGKGFLIDLGQGIYEWIKSRNLTYKNNQNPEIEKIKNEFDKIGEGKKIIDQITKLSAKDVLLRAGFTQMIGNNYEYYDLTEDQKNKLIKYTTIEDGKLIYKSIGNKEIKGYPIYKQTPDEFVQGSLQNYYWGMDNKNKKPLKDIFTQVNESFKKNNNMINEEKDGKKFGEDNFKHWKDTFEFQSADEKNPGQYKEVNIKMDDVMDRIDHYRKKYDEDDAFVRAVIDTHEEVVRIMFTKDLAHIHEGVNPKGLAYVLSVIRESRGEKEVWSVARPANGNWFLVKGDFNQKQLANMDLKKNEPKNKESEKTDSPLSSLKKKEETIINSLKSNEKENIESLPTKVKQKIKEKLSNGWTTETPFKIFDRYYDKSTINSVFNDKIEIYKLKPSFEFFNDLEKNSTRVNIKRGFCRSLVNVKKDSSLTDSQERVVNHFINKCKTQYDNKFGVKQRDLN